ncbi:sortase [Candidatus Peregrinibacteria bacterium]|nr:sortase [Candidatus Peregrinibacteria bacterium]
MHKRLIAPVLVAFILAGTRFPAVSARSFGDTLGTRYNDSFSYLSDRSIVQGYNDGTGRPHELVNRAEALKIVLEMQEASKAMVEWFSKHMPPMALFLDADQKAWYGPYLEAGFQEGVITGYDDRTFRPGNPLTVEEAITLLMRSQKATPAEQPFHSNSSLANQDGLWFSKHLSAAIAKNLVSSREVLRLNQYITRGQFFDIAYRLDVVKREGLAAFNRPEPVVQVASAPRPVAVVAPRPVAAANTAPRPVTPPPSPVNIAAAGDLAQYASDRYFSITIPALGIKDLLITHPADPFTSNGMLAPLKSGVGHLFSYPGNGGKILIYGHSSGYPWDVSKFTKIFRTVNKLNRGDKVYVTYNGNLYVYEVSYENAVPAKDTSAFSGAGEELILYTCWPPDSISQRYLIHAFPVKTVALR